MFGTTGLLGAVMDICIGLKKYKRPPTQHLACIQIDFVVTRFLASGLLPRDGHIACGYLIESERVDWENMSGEGKTMKE